MTLDPTTFIELWRAWGPLLSVVLGGMSLAIAALVLGYREREKEIRCLRDAAVQAAVAANERYIALLSRVLEAVGNQATAMEALREGLRLEDKVADVDSKVTTALERLPRGGRGDER